MESTPRPKVVRSLAALAAASLALALGACSGPVGGGQQESQDQSGGSATSGTVNWWGWTPTDPNTQHLVPSETSLLQLTNLFLEKSSTSVQDSENDLRSPRQMIQAIRRSEWRYSLRDHTEDASGKN